MYILVTAGSSYLDIDAYACAISMAELLRLKGFNAVAFSKAKENYSVCKSIKDYGKIENYLPKGWQNNDLKYIIVDVSDPEYLEKTVDLDNVVAIYDHHVGFEKYWEKRIGKNAHIEFIGAAATLIYRVWKESDMLSKMSSGTARLLIAAILDNTLNLTSTVTTQEDIDAFNSLCTRENVDGEWCAKYFSEVQNVIESDLKNALLNDIKTIKRNGILPLHIGQLTVWDVSNILKELETIRLWLNDVYDEWMLNLIDIRQNRSYFICDKLEYQAQLRKNLDLEFYGSVAKAEKTYLRKEIIKITK